MIRENTTLDLQLNLRADKVKRIYEVSFYAGHNGKVDSKE